MASYIVLARKWRPQTFADLVGQQHVAVTLQNAIAQNRVAHAFLFTGSRGVGKTSTARIFAKALNCAHAPVHEPCNECQSCREITEGHAMDVIEIDGASNRGINEIRDILDAVRYAPSRDRYKIYIIDEVHMLTTEAFNALLKTLEEPPPHVIFIFATTDPNKVPITIVSRCQRYDFKRIQTDDLVAHLDKIAKSENIAFEPSALRLIARTARGGVRDALSAMDQIIAFAEQPITGERAAEVLGVASRETLLKMGESIVRRDIAGALACIDRVDHYGQSLSQFAFDLLEFWRDVTVVAATKEDVRVELNAQEKAQVRSWLSLTSFDRLQRIFNIWYQTSELLPKSLSPRLVMEMATVRMCQVETVVPLDGILRKLDAISRAISGQIQLDPDALNHIQEYLQNQSIGLTEDEKKNSPLSPEIQNPKPVSPQPVPVVRPEIPVKTEPAVTPPPQVNPKPVVETPPQNVSIPGLKPEIQVKPDPKPEIQVKPEEKKSEPVFEDNPEDIIWPDEEGQSEISLEDLESLNAEADLADIYGDDDNAEDESESPNDALPKKVLAVSENRPKTAPATGRPEDSQMDIQMRWKQIVARIGAPLSTILMRARVDCLTRNSASITLPNAYHGMLTQDHIREIEHQLAQQVSSSCRLSVRFDEIGDESETLAAQEARAIFESQQKAFEKARQHPLMQAIISSFHIEPDSIRFTFNSDRKSS